MTKSTQPVHYQFEESTFRYMEQLFRLAFSKIGNTDDAEDIVQETYLKAYRGFGGVRQPDSVKNWLTQILINTVRDHQRKGMRTVPTVDISDIDEENLLQSSEASPEDQVCHYEIDPVLCQALKAIPEEYVTPLLMREIDGASYDEIAQALEIPVGTVMSRLFRARTKLRNALLPESSPEKIPVSPGSGNKRKKVLR